MLAFLYIPTAQIIGTFDFPAEAVAWLTDFPNRLFTQPSQLRNSLDNEELVLTEIERPWLDAPLPPAVTVDGAPWWSSVEDWLEANGY